MDHIHNLKISSWFWKIAVKCETCLNLFKIKILQYRIGSSVLIYLLFIIVIIDFLMKMFFFYFWGLFIVTYWPIYSNLFGLFIVINLAYLLHLIYFLRIFLCKICWHIYNICTFYLLQLIIFFLKFCNV